MDQQARRLLDIARTAGQAILEVYQQDFSVEHKEDSSPLTAELVTMKQMSIAD